MIKPRKRKLQKSRLCDNVTQSHYNEAVLCLAFVYVRHKMQVKVERRLFFCRSCIISKVLAFMISVQEKKSVLHSLPVHSSEVWVVGESATEQWRTSNMTTSHISDRQKTAKCVCLTYLEFSKKRW